MLDNLFTKMATFPVVALDIAPADLDPVIYRIAKDAARINRESFERNKTDKTYTGRVSNYQVFYWHPGQTEGLLKCQAAEGKYGGLIRKTDKSILALESGAEKFSPFMRLIQLLEAIKKTEEDKEKVLKQDLIFVISGCQKYFSNTSEAHPTVVAMLNYLFRFLQGGLNRIVILGHGLNLHSDLAQIPVGKVDLPSLEKIKNNIKRGILPSLSEEGNGFETIESDEDIEKLAFALKGLCLNQVKDFFQSYFAESDTKGIPINLENALASAYTFRSEILKQQGLQLIDTSNAQSLGGLENLKSYAQTRKSLYSLEAQKYHLKYPKGVLLVGPMGTGKTVSASMLAKTFNLPLIKLNISEQLDKFVGQSEQNIKHILTVASAIAPVALFVDEIDRGLQGAGTDSNGIIGRIVGMLLEFMNSNQGVYVIFASNHPESLPPELLRPGRLDEIFFVDFPGVNARNEILRIHAEEQYHCKYKPADLKRIAQETDGYSGAELEQIIQEAALLAYLEGQPQVLTSSRLFSAMAGVNPLSKSRYAYQIESMREFCKDFKNASISLSLPEMGESSAGISIQTTEL